MSYPGGITVGGELRPANEKGGIEGGLGRRIIIRGAEVYEAFGGIQHLIESERLRRRSCDDEAVSKRRNFPDIGAEPVRDWKWTT